jgi:hypothetical protein
MVFCHSPVFAAFLGFAWLLLILTCFIRFETMLKKTYPFYYLLLSILIQCFSPSYGFAQKEDKAETKGKFKTGKWGIEANYMTGQFLKHGVDYIPTQLSQGIEVNYFMKTLGEKPWHKGMNFPEIGATFTFYYFADNKVFGDAVSVMAYGKFYMVRSKIADFYTKIAGGYGVLTRQYNAETNPGDKLISTPVNLAIQLRVGLDWKINQYVQINTAISFNHFSNSAEKLPNYGLNIPSGTIGIRVFPQPRAMSYDCTHDKGFKKNEVMWKVSAGIMQLHSISGYSPTPSTRKYPVPGGMVAYARYINYGIKFYGGLSFEYFPAIHDYLTDNNIHTSRSATFESAIPSAIVGNEFILGRLSMFYSAGVYLWQNTATLTPIYFKLGMNLYFVELKKRKGTKFFFGNNVKAHLNIAQYNEFSLGGTF